MLCDLSLLTSYKMNALRFIFILCASNVLTQDSRSSTKHYCYVHSPIDLSVFNLTTMQHDNNDSTVRISEFKHLRVHFCRPLKDPCNGKQDYAVCLHTNIAEIGVGKEPPIVAVESDKIVFRYTGDKCNKTHNYTVDVEMKCHFSKQDKVASNLDIVFNHVKCNFQMSIETFAACSKRKQAKCDLSDKTGYYNLSPLTNLGSNYMIKVNNSTSVILNVCHSLIYGKHFEQCNHETMVCLVEGMNTQDPSYTRIGNVNDDMHFSTSKGNVHLDLTSDAPCDKGNAKGLQTVRTTIEFVCQRDGVNTMPEYISGIGTCHYKFRWATVAACSEEILIKQSDLKHRPCKVADPLRALYYDFSALEEKVVVVDSLFQNAEYHFSICAPLKKSRCTKEGTGVCKYRKGTNIAVSKGLANSKLIWRGSEILLNYTDGEACGNNRRSYTLIVFKCLYIDIDSIVEDTNPCATIIYWVSPMVCDNTYDIEILKEVLQYDNLYHWSLLTRHHSDYIVQDKCHDTQYHLNVGLPLVNNEFTVCTNGTNACKVIRDNEGKKIKEINLGYQEPMSYVTENGDIFLKYINGSICGEDIRERISTIVTFSCDEEANAVRYMYHTLGSNYPVIEFYIRLLRILQGTPTFKEYKNCTYYFNWKSSHACLGRRDGLSQGCSTGNSYQIFNFTYLIENALLKVNRDVSSGTFSARYCDDVKCRGTFVCSNQSDSGKELETKPDYRMYSLVAFNFANETQCKKDIHYNTLINKWCEMWAGLAESFLINKEECTIGIDWDKHISACQLKGNVTKRTKPVDRSNIPPKDGANVLPNDSKNVPPKDGANAPPKDNTNVPPKESANTSPKDSENTPRNDSRNIISKGNATIPPKDSANISSEDSANIPPKGNANVTPKDVANVPPTDSANTPPKDSATLPLNNGASISPKNSANISPKDTANIPSKDGTDVSPKDSANIPSKDNANILPKDSESIPPKNGENIPPKNSPNIRTKDGANIPPNDSANIPPKDTPNIPSKDGANMPSRLASWYEYYRFHVTGVLVTILIILLVVIGLVTVVYRRKMKKVDPQKRIPNPVVRYRRLDGESESIVDVHMQE